MAKIKLNPTQNNIIQHFLIYLDKIDKVCWWTEKELYKRTVEIYNAKDNK